MFCWISGAVPTFFTTRVENQPTDLSILYEFFFRNVSAGRSWVEMRSSYACNRSNLVLVDRMEFQSPFPTRLEFSRQRWQQTPSEAASPGGNKFGSGRKQIFDHCESIKDLHVTQDISTSLLVFYLESEPHARLFNSINTLETSGGIINHIPSVGWKSPGQMFFSISSSYHGHSAVYSYFMVPGRIQDFQKVNKIRWSTLELRTTVTSCYWIQWNKLHREMRQCTHPYALLSLHSPIPPIASTHHFHNLQPPVLQLNLQNCCTYILPNCFPYFHAGFWIFICQIYVIHVNIILLSLSFLALGRNKSLYKI